MDMNITFVPIMFYKTVKFVFFLLMLSMLGCASQRPPRLIPFSDGEYWVLGNDLVFAIRDSGEKIIVPRGFVTDFASVPRIFWTFFPKHGEYTRAAIVHDFLYWEQRCTREQADELFDILMEDSDVDSTSRFTIYAAVRVWGGDAWEENTLAKKNHYVRIIPEVYINFPIKTKWENYREFLREDIHDDESLETYSSNEAPLYCNALQKKAVAAEELAQEPVKEPVEEPATEPDDMPVPVSSGEPESVIDL